MPICMGDDFGRTDSIYKTRHYETFAEVMEIHVEGASNLLYTRLLHTLNYLPHYHAYAIRRSTILKLLSPKDMHTHSLLYICHLGTDCKELVIVPKYHTYNSVSMYTMVYIEQESICLLLKVAGCASLRDTHTKYAPLMNE